MATVALEYNTEQDAISLRGPQGGYIILTIATLHKADSAMRQALVADSIQKALQLPPSMTTRVSRAVLALMGDTEEQGVTSDR